MRFHIVVFFLYKTVGFYGNACLETVGCVFESRLPCQILHYFLLCGNLTLT